MTRGMRVLMPLLDGTILLRRAFLSVSQDVRSLPRAASRRSFLLAGRVRGAGGLPCVVATFCRVDENREGDYGAKAGARNLRGLGASD
jgi:hypothetical protein